VKATRTLPLAFVVLASLLGSLLAPPAAMAATGVPDHLAYGQQPTNVQSGNAISPAVTVQVLDSDGNLVPDPVNVTVALSGGDPNATLGGTTTQATSGGVATFNDLTVDRVGTGYVLTASLPDFPAVPPLASDPFDVTPGNPDHLKFDQQPTNTVAGDVITPAVTVKVFDANGNLVTDQSVNVTVTLSGGNSNATLGGTTTQASASGVATFDDLTVNKSGTGYLLNATAPGINDSAQSDPFDISSGNATKVKFDQQPSDVVAGQVIAPPVTVDVLDGNGNLVADPTDVTVSLSGGDPNATLGGHTTRTSVDGVATFNDLTVDKADTGYTLVASSGSLQTDTSSAFKVSPGAYDHLAFTTQPVSTPAGDVMPEIDVAMEDALGNVLTNWNANSVTMTIGNNPSGGNLTGTNPRVIHNGVATFTDLKIDKPGTNYTLIATGYRKKTVTSHAFNIQGPTSVTFTASPHQIGYGSRVRLVGHITSCLNPCELTIWKRPAGGVKSLVGTGRVDSHHNLVFTRAPGVDTTYWAEFAGDDRYFGGTSPGVKVLVHVLVRDDLGGVGQAGHDGVYQLFHYNTACAQRSVDCPFIRATLIPETKEGKTVRFTLQALVNGHWETVSVGHNTVAANGNSVVAWVYGGRSVIGVHLRTRAAYAGDDVNSGEGIGPWRYFRIVP
jgi:hypothetical protein